jgi:pimeloyl-ACP methyl ester carboxylesterase
VYTHQTAPTQDVEARGIRFAYRRFGKAGGVPLVFNMHFTGTMDHRDPAVTDGIAKERAVILFDNAGISSSSGEVPTSIEELQRFRRRIEGRHPGVGDQVGAAQLAALAKWGAPRENPFDHLKAITQPTLMVNGDRDVIIYSVNSSILQQHIPNAQLIFYPDANHGSQYQYPERFVGHVSQFLSEEGKESAS